MPTQKLNNSEKLKPCPFCNSTATLYYELDDIEDYIVKCNGCGASSCPKGIRYNRTEAINDWNNRVEQPHSGF